jgi:hypothetical protein
VREIKSIKLNVRLPQTKLITKIKIKPMARVKIRVKIKIMAKIIIN